MERIKEFFQGVRSEVKRVRWADRKRMARASFATISVIIFFALFFFGIDFIIAAIKEIF